MDASGEREIKRRCALHLIKSKSHTLRAPQRSLQTKGSLKKTHMCRDHVKQASCIMFE